MGNEITREKPHQSISLDLTKSEIDIAGLPEDMQHEIREYALKKQIDLQSSALESQKDLQTTAASVGNMADVTRRMSASGDSVTVKQTIENSSGRTEVLMGNTEEAKRGNVSSDQNSWIYVIGGIMILLIIASVLSNS